MVRLLALILGMGVPPAASTLLLAGSRRDPESPEKSQAHCRKKGSDQSALIGCAAHEREPEQDEIDGEKAANRQPDGHKRNTLRRNERKFQSATFKGCKEAITFRTERQGFSIRRYSGS